MTESEAALLTSAVELLRQTLEASQFETASDGQTTVDEKAIATFLEEYQRTMAIPTSRIPGLVPKEWREPAPKSPLSLLLFGKTGDEKAERRATRPGKMLALFYLGKGFALTSQSGSSFMDDFVEQSEGYALDDAPIDYELPTGDGLWIGRMRLVGVGARECIVRVDEWRAPTLEEWSAHLRGEWPWAEELEDATVEPKP